MSHFFVDDKQLGSAADDSGAFRTYEVALQPGEHTIRWVIEGISLGNNRFVLQNASDDRALSVVCMPQTIQLVGATPYKALVNLGGK